MKIVITFSDGFQLHYTRKAFSENISSFSQGKAT